MLCLVSAVVTEISWLIEQLAAEKDGKNQVWFASNPDVILAPVGVGYLESAIVLNRILERFPLIDRLIFTGSAGVYPNVEKVNTGDLCSCLETTLGDGAAEAGLSLYAEPLPRNPIAASSQLVSELYPAKVATLLTLTQSDILATTIQQNMDMELETMELYGIATVCHQKSLPWNTVLGITNRVGSSGHVEWKKTFRQMAQKTGENLLEGLNAGRY